MDRDYLVGLINDLIESREAIKQKIIKLKGKVESHHAACGGVKTSTDAVSAVGTLFAPYTAGVSMFLTAGAVAARTAAGVVDKFKSDDYIKKIQRIADQESDPAEKLDNALEQLVQMATELSEERTITFGDAFLRNLKIHVKDSDYHTRRKLMDAIMEIKRKYEMKIQTGLDEDEEIESTVVIEPKGGMIRKIASKVANRSLFFVSKAFEANESISKWDSCHPTVKQMDTLISDIDEGIEDLFNLRKCLLDM